MFVIKKSANLANIKLKIKNLDNIEKQTIRKTFYEIGKDLVADTKEIINKTPKTGKMYRRYYGQKGALKRPSYYTASAPGESPAVVTGKLRKSINFTVSGNYEMKFGVDLDRANADYGKYLEYRNLIAMTGRGSKNIAPRPFISAAYIKNKNKIEQRFSTAINQVIKK